MYIIIKNLTKIKFKIIICLKKCNIIILSSIIVNDILVHRIINNLHLDLPDFSSAALLSIDVATAVPHSSALHMKQSFGDNVSETYFWCIRHAKVYTEEMGICT